MALDGMYLSLIAKEINALAIGSRVDKVVQPSRDEIILHLRWHGGGGKLLLCSNASSARIHFTNSAPENPKTPPMFCMLLRKHIAGSHLIAAVQTGLDRILQLDFATQDEFGQNITVSIIIEIMSRHSNIILVGEHGKIIDCAKRVDFTTSSVRQVLPGMQYLPPPTQDKLNICTVSAQDIIDRLLTLEDTELSKGLMNTLQGVCVLVCREIAFFATRGAQVNCTQLNHEQLQRLVFSLKELAQRLEDGQAVATMLLELDGRPKDFTFLPISQYGGTMATRPYPDCSSLLSDYFAERDRTQRVHARSGDLLKLLANAISRIERKITAQQSELVECAQRDQLKILGDLISANLYNIKKGDCTAVVSNFYDQDGADCEIQLDPQLTPAQNAQRYYSQYRKADTAEKILTVQIQQGKQEIQYLDSVFDSLTRAAGESELDAIRAELVAGGYARNRGKANGKKKQKHQKLSPIAYTSVDGYTILVGRNNVQNDQLTLKDSTKSDLWFHVQKQPGSHTIVKSQGEEIPQTTIVQACEIAAKHSKACDSSKVAVDYTTVKNVKKPSGAKPGMVIYDHYKTLTVDPYP